MVYFQSPKGADPGSVEEIGFCRGREGELEISKKKTVWFCSTYRKRKRRGSGSGSERVEFIM